MTATTPRRVVVTGAAGGIGRALVEASLERGDTVFGIDLAPAPDGLTGARWYRCDITDEVAVRSVVSAVVADSRGCDVVFNNVAIRPPAVPFLELTAESWRSVIDVNVTGSFIIAQAFARSMVETGGGVIVNTSSQLAQSTLHGHAAYSASKAALDRLTASMALELGSLGIRVVGVAPGIVDTAMLQDVAQNPSWAPARLARIPLGRFASAPEIADLMHLIASDAFAYAHGTTFVVDGGYLVGR